MRARSRELGVRLGVLDALFTATTVVGRDRNRAEELPTRLVVELLDRHGRLA